MKDRISLKITTLFFFVMSSIGCALLPPSLDNTTAILLLHGASINGLPYNSKRALEAALLHDNVHGIEVDVVLTKDHMPILVHDPWLDSQHCRRTDSSVMEYVLIKDILWNDLKVNYECYYPALLTRVANQADKKYERLISLPYALNKLKSKPGLKLYLDVKIQDEFTKAEFSYAKAVSDALITSGVSNDIFIEVPTAQAIRVFDEFIGQDNYQSVISYPAFYAGENWSLVGALKKVEALVSPATLAKLAKSSNADIVMSPTVVMTKSAVKKLHKKNIKYGTFLIDSEQAFKKVCAYKASLMVVDYFPEMGCF